MLINVKMPTIVGILNIYEQDKFRAQLSWAWKKFYNLRPDVRTMFVDKVPLNISLKAAYSVTMNIFRKKNIFFLNHLQK